jgi:C4-dicarboxylate-specific signal transduction histidine kinase
MTSHYFVRDNGPGIPQDVVDNFQPFFTKPTGQGTGLGLSLSYIVKAWWELKVETNEGEGAVFIIHLPI